MIISSACDVAFSQGKKCIKSNSKRWFRSSLVVMTGGWAPAEMRSAISPESESHLSVEWLWTPGKMGKSLGALRALRPKGSHGSCHCPKKKVIAVGIVKKEVINSTCLISV